MLKKATLKPTKLNIIVALLALLLAVGGVLGFSLTARADSGPDEDEITDWVDWDAVAAQTIGVDVDAMFNEMMDKNESIAGVAQTHNVEPQQVVDAIVDAEKDWLAQQVAKGAISQKEADEMLATEPEFRKDVRAYIEEKDVFVFDEGDFPEDEASFEGVDWFSVAAQTIGIEVDALFDEWDQGKSLADVAKAHNVEPQQVTDAIVAAEKEQIAQLAANDELSRDEAAEWLAELENEAAFFVKVEGCVDWFDVAAKTIGVEVDALFAAMDKDQSIADVAKANNVEAQKVVAAIVAAEKTWLNEQVANGALSQDEADEWLLADNDLAEEVSLFVEQAGGEEFFGDEGVEFTDDVDWFDVAAKTIGVEVDALFNEMGADKSIANVAQAHNVEAQKVVAAIIAAEKTWLDEQVANKALSQEGADEWLSFLTEDAQTFIEMSAEAMSAPMP